MEGVCELWEALKEGFVRSFLVEFPGEVIEPGLLLQAVLMGWLGGFSFEGEVHALMAAVLLWMAGFDALDSDAQTEPPARGHQTERLERL